MNNGPVFEAGPGWGARMGSWIRNNLFFVVPGIIVIVIIVILLVQPDGTGQLGSALSASPASSVAGSKFTETIQPGDSYTLVARRMINAVAMTNRSTLQPGQLVYAETILAQKIKNQPLKVGSQISLDIQTISDVIDSFSTLSSYQQARWAQYRR